MIYKPTLDSPKPSIVELRAEQERLHKKADEMLAKTKLKEVFQRLGRFNEIGGSYSYHLLVYPDLDLGVTAKSVDRGDVAELLKQLALMPEVRKVSFVDNVKFKSKNKGQPKGYWIGLQVPYEDDIWGIDCWIQQEDWVHGEDLYSKELKALDQDTKDIILGIKYDRIYQDLYGSRFKSVDVYDAVLNKGVISTEEMLKIV